MLRYVVEEVDRVKGLFEGKQAALAAERDAAQRAERDAREAARRPSAARRPPRARPPRWRRRRPTRRRAWGSCRSSCRYSHRERPYCAYSPAAVIPVKTHCSRS